MSRRRAKSRNYLLQRWSQLQTIRYVINGGVAAVAHYIVLLVCLHGLQLASAGVSNFLAAIAGTGVSFFGNRHFVFRSTNSSLRIQLAKFAVLYLTLAVIQGIVMWAWADVSGLDYRLGFGLGLALQIVGSYLGSKYWVFSFPSRQS